MFSLVAQELKIALWYVISEKSHPHRRISCRTLHAHGLTAYLFFHRTALRLCSPFQTGVSPAIRNQGFRLGVLPNRGVSQVMSPTILLRSPPRKLQQHSYPPRLRSRKASVGSSYNSGEDVATTRASSEVDERPNLGVLASPLLTQERDKCSSIQDLSLYH